MCCSMEFDLDALTANKQALLDLEFFSLGIGRATWLLCDWSTVDPWLPHLGIMKAVLAIS